ncbi:peptide/nickel transport system permease protein [Pseudaminobacter salicylatoxidans]|uniref:Peptide/nickel transport system permease protein n=1 Tax=Pseudaminobacter salicylatoxidans TaxID=93369 RepID=A0A316C4B1_PSESE|nr:ABC transporter permease [Pseudaminobacter salicylatoxidans]PWJ84602.1 peptide/nickel transport system permease protein [Pseudaminobacter salicylatoxidans]
MAKIWILLGERLALGLVTLVVVSALIFVGVELLPGDLAQQILGQSATPETVAAFRRELGLDQPALYRYMNWLGGVVHGEFGNSLANGRPISDLLGVRLKNTLFLAGFAAVISVPTALILGILAALYRNSIFDRLCNVIALTWVSLPEFFVAYVLVLFLAVRISLFPAISSIDAEMSLAEMLYRSFLPALTLMLVVIAHMMRMTRAAIINVLASPYVEMARLKGLSRMRVVLFHALPNALAPIINVVALNLAYLVVGVVVVEVVFVYPGLGQLLVDAVSNRDVMVVQSVGLIFAAAYILLNLLADILSIVTNPRLMNQR